MSAARVSPAFRVRALWRRVASHLLVGGAAGSISVLGTLLLLSWLGGRFGLLGRPSPVPLLLWLLTVLGLGIWLWRVAVRLARWDQRAAAAEIEQRSNLPRGSVQGAVEPGLERPGTSRSLIQLHQARLAQHLKGIPTRRLGARLARTARYRAGVTSVLALTAAVALAAIWSVSPQSASHAWATLAHPLRNLSVPPLPALSLEGESDRVRRGEDLNVRVGAPARDSIELHWQPRGEVAHGRWLAVADGRAASIVPRVESPTLYWASAPDGAVSDSLQVDPVDPLLLLGVQVSLRYPAHTKRDLEILSSPLPVMTLPEGTWTTVTAKTTRPVARAALQTAGGNTISFELEEDRRFSKSFVARDGVWGWEISGLEGDSLEGSVDSIHFVTVPDSAPSVRIVYPGTDTILSLDMIQPLMIDLRDDYGLRSAELVSWRVSAWGELWPETVESLSLADDAPRASLNALLDARGRGFLPGDTLHYYVRARDNAPEPQVGRSREYVLRLPDLTELRERTLTQAHELVESAEDLAESARAQQEAAEALQRATEISPAPGATNGSAAEEESVEFRETEAARQALEEANELIERAREIQEELQELQEAIERSGLNDESLLERLEEIESLYRRILTPELEEKLEALREALVDLDSERIREAIKELAEGSADFRQRVEQSVELLKRAAMEQEFQTLETQADELAKEHEQLAESAAEADSLSETLQDRAEQLGEQSQALSELVSELVNELSEAGEAEAADQASEAQQAAGEAGQLDAQAASQMESNRQQASRSAQSARQQMKQAASSLQQGREQMQEDWRQEVVEALDRARAEALELARRQRELNERLGSNGTGEQQSGLRSDEVALKRGLDQIERQLTDAMESTLLIDPALVAAIAETQAGMAQLLQQLADGTRRRPASSGLANRVSESLNELAYRLMEASEAASAAESGTGMQEALEQLAQLAQQQGELNAQSGGLSPGGLSDALLQQLQRIAAQQRGIAQDLQGLDESLGPRGQVLGELDALAGEAEDIASELDAGRLDEKLIQRQRELFRKLLDAGRTLEQDEFEKERRAERPTTTEIFRPGDLPPELLQGRQYPHPGAEALRSYPPAFRRLILEYFDRLNGLEGGAGGS
ncbi:MAG: hypothetical protein V3S83_04820 [Gemmatimonadota bacterium]